VVPKSVDSTTLASFGDFAAFCGRADACSTSVLLLLFILTIQQQAIGVDGRAATTMPDFR